MRRGLKRDLKNHERAGVGSFKPIPDEEGTETSEKRHAAQRAQTPASNRSPMRRGLKRIGANRGLRGRLGLCFKPIPDEEGTETWQLELLLELLHQCELQTDPR